MSLPQQCRHGVMKKFCSDCHPQRKDLQKQGVGMTVELKLIYKYMEESWILSEHNKILVGFKVINNYAVANSLDSNSAWECVQEISKKGEWWGFHDYAIKNMPEGITYQHEETRWLMNPTNFFSCMGEWLKERSKL